MQANEVQQDGSSEEDRLGEVQILIVPGIGEDERMSYPQEALPFRLIRPRYIEPRSSDNLASYAARFASELRPLVDLTKPLFLMGVSLGTAVVQELAKHLPARGLILISGYRTSGELAAFFRILGRHIAPRLPLWFYEFGKLFAYPVVASIVSGPKKDVALCATMYRDFPKRWFREQARMGAWWKGCSLSLPVLRIHGKLDPIFPYRWQRDVDLLFPRTRHMCNFAHRDIVNGAIEEWIRKIPRSDESIRSGSQDPLHTQRRGA